MLVAALLISVVKIFVVALLVVVAELMVALISMALNRGVGCFHDSGSGMCQMLWCADDGVSVFLVNLMADRKK